MAADDTSINFESNAGATFPDILTQVQQFARGIEAEADESQKVILFGNLTTAVEDALGSIARQLPDMLRQIRTQISDGLLPADLGAQASRATSGLIDSLTSVKEAIGSGLGGAELADQFLRPIAQAKQGLEELKALAREGGASPQQIGAVTRQQTRLTGLAQDIGTQLGLPKQDVDNLIRSLQDQVTAGQAAATSEKALTEANTKLATARKEEAAEADDRKRKGTGKPRGGPKGPNDQTVDEILAGPEPAGSAGGGRKPPPPPPVSLTPASDDPAGAHLPTVEADVAKAQAATQELGRLMQEAGEEPTKLMQQMLRLMAQATALMEQEQNAPTVKMQQTLTQMSAARREMDAALNQPTLDMQKTLALMKQATALMEQEQNAPTVEMQQTLRQMKQARDEMERALNAPTIQGQQQLRTIGQAQQEDLRRTQAAASTQNQSAYYGALSAQATAKNPDFANIEQVNQGVRDLGNGYRQLNDVLLKQSSAGLQVIQGEREEYEARNALIATLAREQKESPSGFISGVTGGLFGHGFDTSQRGFNPQTALGNLGGTLGVVARYSTEYRAFSAITESMKSVYEQTQSLTAGLILYQGALEATGAKQVNLNAAFDTGAKYGLNESDSLALGTAGLKAYQDEIKAGANASDIFTESVKQAGIAAQITGQQAAEAQTQLIAATNVFNLGSAGQGRINDTVLAASQNFAVPPAAILKGLGTAGDLANVGGFTPDLLANTLGAVQQTTGSDQSSQITRDLSQGGSPRFRTALANLGVTYNAADVAGTLQKAGDAYAKLTDAQKNNLAISLGGARSASSLIALLKDQKDIVDATSKSYLDGGKSAQEAANYNKTLGGTIKQIGAEAKDLAADLGKSGILDFFGLMLATIKPILTGLDDMAKLLDKIPGGGAVLGGVLAARGLAGLGGGAGLLGASAEATGIGGTLASAGRNVGAGAGRLNIFNRGGGRAATTTAHTRAVVSDTEATVAHTKAAQETLAQDATQLEQDQAKFDQGALEIEQLDASTVNMEALNAAMLEAVASVEGHTLATEADTAAVSENAAAQAAGGGVGGLGRVGAAEEGGAAAGAGEAAAGVGAGGVIGGAIADAIVGYESYKKSSDIISKKNAAESAAQTNVVSADPNQLRANASAANQAAQNAAISSGGLFGSFENFFSGGNSKQIADARETSARDAALADKLDKIASTNAAKGSYGQLDLSSPESLDNSFQAVQKSGASLTDQMTLLNLALDALQPGAAGATHRLSTADQQKAGAVAGAFSAQSIQQAVADAKTNASDVPWYANRKQADALTSSLKGVDTKKLQDAAEKTVDDFLKANPDYNPSKKNAQGQTGERQLVNALDKSFQNVPGWNKLSKDEQGGILGLLGTNVNQTVKPDPNAPVTDATVLDIFSKTQTTAQAQQQALATQLSVGDYSQDPGAKKAAAGGQETAVTAAQDYLTKIKAARDKAVSSKKLNPNQIKDLDSQVDAAQAQFNAAVLQQYADQVTINQSSLALTDTVGRDNEQLAGDLEALHATTDAGAKRLAAAKVKADKAQTAADTAQQQAASIAAGAGSYSYSSQTQTGTYAASSTPTGSYDPRDIITNAGRKLQGDQDLFAQIAQSERGLKQHSLGYWQAWMAMGDDQQALIQDTTDQANAAVAAAADPSSAIESAQVTIQQATNTMKSNLFLSTAWLQGWAQYQQGLAQQVTAQVQDESNIASLAGDPTNPVFVATQALNAAKNKLAKDRARPNVAPDTLVADQVDINAKQQAQQKAGFDQFLADNQTNYDLHRESFTQYLRNLEARDALLKAERAGLSSTSDGYRQLTDEVNQTEQSILQATQQLTGQFNLGDIKVPSVYEIRRQVASTQAGVGFTDARVTSITINGIGSTQEVVQIVKQQLGTSATVTRAPATVKKA